MKLTDRMRYTICFLAGGSLIVVGLVSYFAGIPFNPRIMNGFEFLMMMVVVYFLFIYPKKVSNQVAADESETIDTAKKEDNLEK